MSGATEGIRFKSEQSKAQAEKLRFTERQATAINRTMDALKDILLHGLEIGAFSDETDVMLYVQILYTVLEGASNTVAQDEDIDEKAVWAGIVELMFK